MKTFVLESNGMSDRCALLVRIKPSRSKQLMVRCLLFRLRLHFKIGKIADFCLVEKGEPFWITDHADHQSSSTHPILISLFVILRRSSCQFSKRPSESYGVRLHNGVDWITHSTMLTTMAYNNWAKFYLLHKQQNAALITCGTQNPNTKNRFFGFNCISFIVFVSWARAPTNRLIYRQDIGTLMVSFQSPTIQGFSDHTTLVGCWILSRDEPCSPEVRVQGVSSWFRSN